MRNKTAIFAAALALLTASGCAAGADGLESGDGYSVLGALEEIPASAVDDLFHLSTADIASAIEASGLERGTGLDPEEHRDWLMALTAGTSPEETGHLFVPLTDTLGFSRIQQLEEFHGELGWSLATVDAFVEVDATPQRALVVAGDVELSPDLAAHEDGYVSAGEGEDLWVDMETRTAARPLGSPLRLAQDGDRIISSTTTEPVQAWLDGDGETLADDEELAAIASALDDADVLSAMLAVGMDFSTGGGGPGGAGGAGPVPSDPFTSIGIGWALDDITIVYAFADERAAGDAVAVFEQQFAEGTAMSGEPLSSFLTLVDAGTEGSLLVLTVEPTGEGRASFPVNALQRRDLPFLHR